jgi:DNA-binding MarR family transcriptional regulator
MACRALELKGRSAAAWKSVLWTLADHHNGQTGRCCPGLDAIALGASVSRGSVTRILTSLEASHLIAVERPGFGGRGRSNSYTLKFVEIWEKRGRPARMETSGATACFTAQNGRQQLAKRAAAAPETGGSSAETGGSSAETGGGDAPNLESYESMNPRARDTEEARAEKIADATLAMAIERFPPLPPPQKEV